MNINRFARTSALGSISIVILLGFQQDVWAQDPGIRPELNIKISIVKTSDIHILDTISLLVDLSYDKALPLAIAPHAPKQVNASSQATQSSKNIIMQSLSVNVMGTLKDVYPADADCGFKKDVTLKPGVAAQYICVLQPTGDPYTFIPPTVILSAGTHYISAKATYYDEDGSREDTHSQIATTSFAIGAAFASVFYGGVAGALLVGVFIMLSHLAEAIDQRGLQTWRPLRALAITFQSFLYATIWSFLGGIAATMMILLSRASLGAGSPLEIKVADFSGGLLLGLLSYPLVSWLRGRLVQAAPESDKK